MLDRVFALPLSVDGITARLTPAQWDGLRTSQRIATQSINHLIDKLDMLEGAAAGATKTLLVGGLTIAAVAFFPVTATLAGGVLLAGAVGYTAGLRASAGQSKVEVVAGTAADLTGVNSIYMSFTERDIATGEEKPLTPYQKGDLLGSGVTQLFLTVGGLGASATGGGGASVKLQLPVPRLAPGAVVSADGALAAGAAGWTWTTAAVGGMDQAVLATSTTVGTVKITTVLMNSAGTGTGGTGSYSSLGEQIANGHAYQKHVIEQGEFPGVHSRAQFARVIDKAVADATAAGEVKSLSGGRTAYWDGATGTVVIHNPSAADGGTAFKPRLGKVYYDNLH